MEDFVALHEASGRAPESQTGILCWHVSLYLGVKGLGIVVSSIVSLCGV